jgi:hypothetical protein
MTQAPLATILTVAALLGGGAAQAATAAPPPGSRTAIVVGATASSPGRAALRHAHHDAEAIRDALVSVGGFEPGHVHVLRDPEPEALLALVSREATALSGVPQGLLFFYFSGHADGSALYSAGKPVSVEALRAVLDRPEVSLRVGVLDACQGGGWTRAKGLVPDAPFEVPLPPLLASEGSALIASSSGSESAHESDLLGGSFFTHHFVAALRGAGDENHRGEVTLTGAFEYARQQTIRETARRAAEPQHPSFALNLRGRQDLVLAQVTTSPSVLAVEQEDGPIELVHLGSGLRLLELPPGRRQVTVAVPPGTYLVRKVGAAGVVLAKEVVVPPTGSARVSEHELVLVASGRLVVKGEERRVMPSSWPAAGGGELGASLKTWRDAELQYWSLGTGDPYGAGAMARFDGRIGITDRLAWKIGTLAVTYRLGETGGVEVAPYAGLLAWTAPLGRAFVPYWGWDHRGAGEVRFGGGFGLRAPYSVGALVLTLGYDTIHVGRAWATRVGGAIGLSVTLGKAVIHLATTVVSQEEPGSRGTFVYLGSVQDFGLETLPLVRISPWDTWALDFFASGGSYTRVSYRLGVSRKF